MHGPGTGLGPGPGPLSAADCPLTDLFYRNDLLQMCLEIINARTSFRKKSLYKYCAEFGIFVEPAAWILDGFVAYLLDCFAGTQGCQFLDTVA